MRPLCVFHADCIDGFSAAWVVSRALNDHDMEFLPAKYGDVPPDVTGRDVYIVDFSYKLSVMQKLISCAKTITVLDHHKSAEAAMAPLVRAYADSDSVVIKFNMEHSGAGLAWKHLFPNELMPTVLAYVEDYDLYRFTFGMATRQIHAALSSYPQTLGVWDGLMEQYSSVETLKREGIALMRESERQIAEILKHNVRTMVIGGYAIPVANSARIYRNEVCERLYADPAIPFAATYIDTTEGREFSLRADANRGLDVSLIAQVYSGGGHKPAAGFVMKHGWEGDVSELDKV